jgi:hypothetical protein
MSIQNVVENKLFVLLIFTMEIGKIVKLINEIKYYVLGNDSKPCTLAGGDCITLVH